MRSQPARPQREFLVEVYGPLFAALGRLSLPSPVRLSDFINEREGFLRLTEAEFLASGPIPSGTNRHAEYLINKSGIELICQPDELAFQHHPDDEHGKMLWQAFSQMAGSSNPDLRVHKQPYPVQVHTHRFIVNAELHLAEGAAPEAMLSNLPTKFVPVTNATARFINARNEVLVIERKLMLVNRDHILLVEVDRRRHARAA